MMVCVCVCVCVCARAAYQSVRSPCEVIVPSSYFWRETMLNRQFRQGLAFERLHLGQGGKGPEKNHGQRRRAIEPNGHILTGR